MAGKERHLFPGNNTPEGFFSYYHYILDQREAEKIYCLKGGPGVGKSTFMRRIGEKFLEEGEDVDFYHCSSDRNSIDGILLKKRKIAMVDGTSPHIIDPVNPGAVDTIIHLGDYWDEALIRGSKADILDSHDRVSGLFARVTNYLSAAGSLYDNVAAVYEQRIRKEEILKISARMINEQLAHKEISSVKGRIKKFFASAITPQGLVNEIPSLAAGFHTLYLIEAPVGLESTSLLEPFAENAMNRGFDVEAFYCPMKPGHKMEHLLCPSLDLAFITSNEYHPYEPAEETAGEEQGDKKVHRISLTECARGRVSQPQAEIQRDSQERMDALLKQAVNCLDAAKKEHDVLESFYIPGMDFAAIERLRFETCQEIKSHN